ncbi:hypothetical protein ABEB36_008684 [Hypothenemus hampei]|uniref:15-hydroxyprostaglandin dehydrogenase [NAD(+)]-like n=1 Tax=Hypothenemus hampei TaxID=57062 RepID=A0ABD1EMR9_HYPHA
MAFQIEGKVALVTGGASGLGFSFAKELLKNGLKGITVADIDEKIGLKAVQELKSEFGEGRAIFVQTDVTNFEQFDDAFKKTIETYQNIDILINNAGIFDDFKWQKQLQINLNGTINGVLLGLEEYIPKYKSGEEGLIVNISSIFGIAGTSPCPIYSASKFAVHGLTLSWGHPFHYNRTKVRVVGVCPGITLTPLLLNLTDKILKPVYKENIQEAITTLEKQSPEVVASFVMKVIEKAPNGTMWVIEGGKEPYQYVIPDRFNLPKKIFLQ